MSVPRRQRNQPATSRVEDIEFVTQISTSLLSQVRQLQGVLTERDEAVKTLHAEKSQLELEAEGLTQRLKLLDESEQRYKDENWGLETRTHDLIAAAKENASKEQRLQQALAIATAEKNAAQRELDDVKQAHGKLSDDYHSFRNGHDSEASNFRKNILVAESDRDTLQRKIDELTSQNSELARAMTGKFRPGADSTSRELGSDPEDLSLDKSDTEYSPPPSPSKGAVRNSALESETLKSSLHHAHRMIQNLKSGIHREKAEKLELRRMLQESRDELEARRGEGSTSSASKRLRSKMPPDSAKKVQKPSHLGAGRQSRIDVEVDNADWEDHHGAPSALSGSTVANSKSNAARMEGSDAYQTATEAEDAFETANERDPGTETEAFQTGNESFAGESSDDLTETEGGALRSGTVKGKRASPLPPVKRSSFISTASTSDDEQPQDVKTPVQQAVKYKMKVGKGLRRSKFGSESPKNSPSSMKDSPASFASNRETKGRSLFAELGGLEDNQSDAESDENLGKSEQSTQYSSPNVESRTGSDFWIMTEPSLEEKAPAFSPSEAGLGRESPSVQHTTTVSPSTSSAQQPTTSRTSEPIQASSLDADPSSSMTQSVNDLRVDQGYNMQLLSFSTISSVETVPTSGPDAIRGSEADRPSTAIYGEANGPPQESGSHRDSNKTGVLGSVLGWAIGKRQQDSEAMEEKLDAPRQPVDRRPGSEDPDHKITVNESQDVATEFDSSRKIDSGSQTALSSSQIDSLLSQKSNRTPALYSLQTADSQLRPDLVSPTKIASLPSPTSTTSSNAGRDVGATPRSIKRLNSGSSVRPSSSDIPPLPADHREAIAAAQQVPMREKADLKPENNMGPPSVPASAYRSTAKRPQTPSDQTLQTPASAAPRARYSTTRSNRSRRSSVSSFESEIDARFNIRADGLPIPQGLENSTDPRMIQAITQTMIGEYLWKYTRKAGRGEMSDKRHRRFFWVHPYTRTLYWSDQDPSTAGRVQLKAKSVAIEAVRVVVDDNPLPPGLHRKSLIVITPGRDVKFTATTGQRHETWFNALSYLLLRSGSDMSNTDPNHITAEDVAEFNPGFGRSAGSRLSLSSYNSRTNTTRRSLVSNRTASPTKGSVRRIPPTPHASSSSRFSHSNQPSIGHRISNYWRPSRASTVNNREGAVSASTGSIYNASVVNDSAEDVRQVLEKQDQESDRVENVRACCDGASNYLLLHYQDITYIIS